MHGQQNIKINMHVSQTV